VQGGFDDPPPRSKANLMFDAFDDEMRRRGLDTVLVMGESTLGNPELAYVTGTLIPRGGIFLKRIGQRPLLVVSNIDVGSAKRGRIKNVRTYTDYGYEKLVKLHGREQGYIKFLDAILRSLRTRADIGIYSRNEFSHLLSVTDSLRRLGYRVAGETDASLIESLRETKDPEEIDRIREVGTRAARVVERMLELLRKCTVSSGKLRLKHRVLTVGMVKSRINLLLAEQDLMAPEGTVFAVGPSSADPHQMGIASEPIRAGAPIVFDLFPVGTDGYWFDLTRTYVVGKPLSKVKKMLDAVREVQTRVLDSMGEGTQASKMMSLACDLFERRQFKTIRAVLRGDKDATRVGFIHSLGHGVGLTIGERPQLSLFSDETLRRGHVVTVEPGLYEPGLGGVRIEDTIVITKRGIDNLTPLEKEFRI
jgi:Xaa-Pro aminopeptidase